MKRLLLLRHAKAIPAAEPLADIARPLAPRGTRDAGWVGERLFRHGFGPQSIVTSPAARALHTAQIVASAVGYPRENIVIEHRLYLAEPSAILAVVAAQDSQIESLLVVGHNPGLSELVLELLPTFETDDLPTMAIVGLAYEGGAGWAQIGDAMPRLDYYDFPKNARAPVTGR